LRSCIFLFSALYLQPILFLFLYFCIFHSPRHTLEIYDALKYKSFLEMFKNQLPILILSIASIIGLFLFQSEISQNDMNLFKSLIIFIASVTIPHMVLVEYFKFKKKST
jgi:Brp/Blh family beta-carotene 15,15'-monooxygenase